MTSVFLPFTILDATPEKVWSFLADFTNWDRLLIIKDARKGCWGNRLVLDAPENAPRTAPGEGSRLLMFHDEKLMQVWEVDIWMRPGRLKLSSREFHGTWGLDQESSLDFELSPDGETAAKVSIRMKHRFSHPFIGLGGALIPMKSRLLESLRRFRSSLTAMVRCG